MFDSTRETNALEYPSDLFHGSPQGLRGEGEIFSHRQVVVERSLVTEPPNTATKLAQIPGAQIHPAHDARATGQGRESPEQAQQAGLACAVRSGDDRERAGVKIERDTAQQRIAICEDDCLTQNNNRRGTTHAGAL